MNESRNLSLEEPVERLERTTEQLRHELRGTDHSRAGRASDVPPGLPAATRKDGGGAGRRRSRAPAARARDGASVRPWISETSATCGAESGG